MYKKHPEGYQWIAQVKGYSSIPDLFTQEKEWAIVKE
jgi:hypothetical protein